MGDQSAIELDGASAGAVFSPDRRHRYRLWRTWDPTKPPCAWIMLNPSLADEHRLDPTLRKCLGFSKRWGHGGMLIANLFALVTPYPVKLRGAEDPVGVENDAHLRGVLLEHQRVVVAWGRVPMWAARRAAAVAALLGGHDVWCLGETGDGGPRHPLYVPYDTPLRPW